MSVLAESGVVEAGDILVSSWGYDQTNVDFYKVVKRSGDWATLMAIGSEVVDSRGSSEIVRPDENNERGKTFRRKIRSYAGKDFVSIDSCSVAKRWNGEIRFQTAVGWGH